MTEEDTDTIAVLPNESLSEKQSRAQAIAAALKAIHDLGGNGRGKALVTDTTFLLPCLAIGVRSENIHIVTEDLRVAEGLSSTIPQKNILLMPILEALKNFQRNLLLANVCLESPSDEGLALVQAIALRGMSNAGVLIVRVAKGRQEDWDRCAKTLRIAEADSHAAKLISVEMTLEKRLHQYGMVLAAEGVFGFSGEDGQPGWYMVFQVHRALPGATKKRFVDKAVRRADSRGVVSQDSSSITERQFQQFVLKGLDFYQEEGFPRENAAFIVASMFMIEAEQILQWDYERKEDARDAADA